MNNPTRRQIRKARIQVISQELEDLSSELNRLLTLENQEENTEANTTEIDQQEHQFEIGNRIQITNSYKGQQGLLGTVTKVTAKQVSIRIDGQRRTINKKKTNVRLIE
jgi:hypothetical protein